MSDQLNRVRFTSDTIGTGSSIHVVAAFSTAYFTPAEAGAVNGRPYSYLITQGNDFEIQQDQIYTASGTTIARGTPVFSKIGGVAGVTKITMDNTAVITFGTSARDLMFDHVRGADVASAATLNLDATTGAFVDITGTATVTAITLAEGQQRWGRATGAFTLTDNAVIDLNGGGANITTAAGDELHFRGYAGGVVKVFVTRADGRSIVRTFTAAATPATNDGAALGTGSLMWSDLFLASGGVINFNNGDVLVTHSANVLAFTGASSGYSFDAPIAPSANDSAPLGFATVSWSDLFLASGGVVNWNNGDVTITHAADTLAFGGAASGYTFSHAILPSVTDGAALGSASVMWSDLFLASGSVVNFNNSDVTITHSTNLLTFAGASSGYSFDAPMLLPAGGVINWNSGDVTLTHSSNVLMFAGGDVQISGVSVGSQLIVSNDGNLYRLGRRSSDGYFIFNGEQTTFSGFIFQTSNGNDRLTINNNGTLRFHNYGSGTLTTDGSGNVTASSDERLKNVVGPFTRGLTDLRKIGGADSYSWKHEAETNPEATYAGFVAQKVQRGIPEAVGVDPDGMLTLQDRPIIAALLNAVLELENRVKELEALRV